MSSQTFYLIVSHINTLNSPHPILLPGHHISNLGYHSNDKYKYIYILPPNS